MFGNQTDLVRNLQESAGEGVRISSAQLQIERAGIGLGALILSLLPEGPHKELAKQKLVECILFCKQSIRLKK